ncbi:MAG: TRAP transporter small permease subunit [Pseudomonadota bacterium]
MRNGTLALYRRYCDGVRFVTLIGVNVAAVFLGIMLTLVLVQIVLRSTIGVSISWSEEIAKSLMTWSAFLAAPEGLRKGQHLSLDILKGALPSNISAIVTIVVSMVMTFVFASIVFHSIQMISAGMAVRSAATSIPVGMFYLVLPVSMIMFFGVVIEIIWRSALSMPRHRRGA